jgi:hypothetical protein
MIVGSPPRSGRHDAKEVEDFFLNRDAQIATAERRQAPSEGPRVVDGEDGVWPEAGRRLLPQRRVDPAEFLMLRVDDCGRE